MELLKSAAKRSVLGETLYLVLNIVLAAAILILVITLQTPWPAYGLVLLSKWRVLAVRARYWAANLRANMVDAIVGLSIVTLIYASIGSLSTQIVLAVLYTVWLLFIKPRSKYIFVAIQAIIGLVFGLNSLMVVSYDWPASAVVAVAWLIGYSATRHVLSAERESHINFLSLLWAFVIAELTWLTYHWTVGYTLPGGLQIAENMIVIVVLSFLAERVYASYRRNEVVKINEIILPLFFTISVLAIVVVVVPIVFGPTAQL